MDWQKQSDRQRIKYGLTAKDDGWYKSVDGKTKYICKPMPIEQAAALMPGRIAEIRAKAAGKVTDSKNMTVEQLVELFLARMLIRVRTSIPKKLERRTYDDYVGVLDRFASVIGQNRRVAELGPIDFTKFIDTLSGRARSTIRREVQYVDRLFNWAGPGRHGMNLVPFVHRGPEWVKPSDDAIRADAADSDKAYTPKEIVTAFERIKDNPMLNAAGHLGLNCGMIPIDIGTLPEEFVRLDDAIIIFPRGKTGVSRICPLVPETVAACRAWLEKRSRLKCDESATGLFFRTRQGFPLARTILQDDESDQATDHNALTRTWSRVVGKPFGGLRSTFATHADDWPDQRAIDMVLGHKVGRVSGHIRVRNYAKKFNPDRVRKLVSAIWPLFFGREAPSSQAPASEASADALGSPPADQSHGNAAS